MTESLDAFAELSSIRAELDEQGSILSAIVRSNPELKESILETLNKDTLMKMVYQLVDGKLTQKEIIAEIKSRGVTTTEMSISRKIEKLREVLFLIHLVRSQGGSPVYARSRLGIVLNIPRAIGKLEKLSV
jgi:hypothetical protein